jgi:hypothetical protein
MSSDPRPALNDARARLREAFRLRDELTAQRRAERAEWDDDPDDDEEGDGAFYETELGSGRVLWEMYVADIRVIVGERPHDQ